MPMKIIPKAFEIKKLSGKEKLEKWTFQHHYDEKGNNG